MNFTKVKKFSEIKKLMTSTNNKKVGLKMGLIVAENDVN